MGVCERNGTVYLAFDAHCEGLRYRVSRPGVAIDSGGTPWTAEDVAFSAVLDMLPGCEGDEDAGEILGELAYARFLSVDGGELLFECRVGMVGRGSCVLFRYGRAETGTRTWRFVGGTWRRGL